MKQFKPEVVLSIILGIHFTDEKEIQEFIRFMNSVKQYSYLGKELVDYYRNSIALCNHEILTQNKVLRDRYPLRLIKDIRKEIEDTGTEMWMIKEKQNLPEGFDFVPKGYKK